MKIQLCFWGFAIACVFQHGCARNTPTPAANAPQPLAVLTETQIKQQEQAVAAKDRLAQSLMAELTQSMSEADPAKSIHVCQTRAPEIVAQISEETGIRIGRTSFKLRNDKNQPPQWAMSFVKNKIDQPTTVALPDDQLGVLLPIHLQPMCTLCHGTNEQVVPEVKTAIDSAYPTDQATGFSAGDLRGYFWMEVPSLE